MNFHLVYPEHRIAGVVLEFKYCQQCGRPFTRPFAPTEPVVCMESESQAHWKWIRYTDPVEVIRRRDRGAKYCKACASNPVPDLVGQAAYMAQLPGTEQQMRHAMHLPKYDTTLVPAGRATQAHQINSTLQRAKRITESPESIAAWKQVVYAALAERGRLTMEEICGLIPTAFTSLQAFQKVKYYGLGLVPVGRLPRVPGADRRGSKALRAGGDPLKTINDINNANRAMWDSGEMVHGDAWSKTAQSAARWKKEQQAEGPLTKSQSKVAAEEARGNSKLEGFGRRQAIVYHPANDQRDTRHPAAGGQQVAHGEKMVVSHDDTPKRQVHLPRNAGRRWRGSSWDGTDASTVIEDARDVNEVPHQVGSQKTLTRAGFPTIRKEEKVTIKEHVPMVEKTKASFGVKAKRDINHRYRVENEKGNSAWTEHGDLE